MRPWSKEDVLGLPMKPRWNQFDVRRAAEGLAKFDRMLTDLPQVARVWLISEHEVLAQVMCLYLGLKPMWFACNSEIVGVGGFSEVVRNRVAGDFEFVDVYDGYFVNPGVALEVVGSHPELMPYVRSEASLYQMLRDLRDDNRDRVGGRDDVRFVMEGLLLGYPLADVLAFNNPGLQTAFDNEDQDVGAPNYGFFYWSISEARRQRFLAKVDEVFVRSGAVRYLDGIYEAGQVVERDKRKVFYPRVRSLLA